MVVGIMLSIFSQVTGINAIMYYAPEIFKSTGDGSGSALLQTIAVGVVNVLFTFVAIKYVDKLGRKKLLLRGIAGMMLCLLIVGSAFYFGAEKGYLVLIAIMAYIAFFAMSLWPANIRGGSRNISNESTRHGNVGSHIRVVVGSFLVSQSFPVLLDAIGNAFYILDLYVHGNIRLRICMENGARNKGKNPGRNRTLLAPARTEQAGEIKECVDFFWGRPQYIWHRLLRRTLRHTEICRAVKTTFNYFLHRSYR